jgi:hypothetical protein
VRFGPEAATSTRGTDRGGRNCLVRLSSTRGVTVPFADLWDDLCHDLLAVVGSLDPAQVPLKDADEIIVGHPSVRKCTQSRRPDRSYGAGTRTRHPAWLAQRMSATKSTTPATSKTAMTLVGMVCCSTTVPLVGQRREYDPGTRPRWGPARGWEGVAYFFRRQ